MKYFIPITVTLLLALNSGAQNKFSEDSLRRIIGQQKGGASEVSALVGLADTRDQIELKVIDNGNGIPQKILDKIFQPFFTTKPTGQGTGLGLSLSYDIIKAHGGDIKVQSKEGDGSEFIIKLPIA